MNAASIWKILKPVLKIVAVGAVGGAVAKVPEALGAASNELPATLAPVAAIIAAYLMKPPNEIRK
jgi:hypothetical protein